ncbi:hypothetical protein XENTR_v10018802 [Xenopus tropicalis]|nr:hypothetical protein XENTR_v10018802 [Xenopus tropicalis]
MLDTQFSSNLFNQSEKENIRLPQTPGILNPTTCINVNDVILFIASKHNFPMYDVNNLYNTNPHFDWGKFREIAEEILLSPQPFLYFMYQFQEPGVYVIKLSSNHYKKMYIRVMLYGGHCYEEGPFFPSSPRHFIRNGIARIPPLLLKPDWPAIIGITAGLLLILIISILFLLWFQDLGWTQKVNDNPQFRKLQLKFNFDSYSSKGSSVTILKKLHPRMRIKGYMSRKSDESDKKKCHKLLEDDEFWDYEQQIDMECFNTQIFYDILLKQSLLVASRLGQLKEEVKTFYEKLVYEVSAFKEIFMKHLNISGYMKRYATSVMEDYTRVKEEAELEIARRKKIAAEYEDFLNMQLQILHQDLKSQEDHCTGFNGALRESVRILEMLKDKYCTEETDAKQSTYYYRKLLLQYEAVCNRMYNAVMKECERLKSWGVLGEGTGAQLVNKEKTSLLSKEDIIALDGSLRECDLVYINPLHGLITPTKHSVMMLPSHYLTPVPGDHFVHSETGRVLPVVGNVGYDPISSQLIPSVDSAIADIWKTELPTLPYIPYPVCPDTGLPVECTLPSFHHQGKGECFQSMVDATSGMEVPILAVTIHPQTHMWLAVGGTYIHPLTQLLSPIEIGGPVMDFKEERIFPILGVQLDSNTGRVLPLGGLMAPTGRISILGDIFTEPLSGKKCRIQGAVLHQGKLSPHAGSYQSLLETNMLLSQIKVIEIIKRHKDLLYEDVPVLEEDFDHIYKTLNKAVETMKKSSMVMEKHNMCRMYNLRIHHKVASDIKHCGGNLGMVMYPKTELWIPAVLGMEIPDPGPSDLMVPILGVEYDFNKGHLIPLAGTMVDSDGNGLIAIKMGANTIDPLTGNRGPVVNARINPMTRSVVPVVRTACVQERDSYMLEVTEKELSLREEFWHSQKDKEDDLMKELNHITMYTIDAAKELKIHKVKVKERMLSLEAACHSLEETSLFETQRRAARNLNTLTLNASHIPFLDDSTEEKEQQMMVTLVVRKTIERLIQFADKMEQETERLHRQINEWQKGRRNAEETMNTKHRMVLLHLVDEFQDHIMKRLAGVDFAYCRLEYLREHDRLQGLLAKSFLLGSAPYFINPQTTYWNARGKGFKDIHQTMIPLLKHMIHIMEDKKNSVLLSDVKFPVSGYSSRSTLKASAANCNFSEASSGISKLQPSAPWLNHSEIFYRHQDYFFRFLIEKHAGELVHLEQLLVAEEINRIWNFYETYKENITAAIIEGFPKVAQTAGKKSHPITRDLRPEKETIKAEMQALERSTDLFFEWERLVEDLAGVHRNALNMLHQRHQEEVKTVGLNPDTVIPGNYFMRDMKTALAQLATDMQVVYEYPYYKDVQKTQEMSSSASKLFPDDKDPHYHHYRTIAAKFVKQELLTQIHTYEILDEYNKLQVANCIEDVQKSFSSLGYMPWSGKAAAEKAANSLEENYSEKLVTFLTKSYKEEQIQNRQISLSEMQSQLKEEHNSLTEKLLQEKSTFLFSELTSSQTRRNVEHIVCSVLSHRHLRQIVILLQDAFPTPKEVEENTGVNWKFYEDIMGNCEGYILSLLQDKGETSLLFMELCHLLKRIQLRECHLEEIATALKEYCSDKVPILPCVEEAHYLANELHILREQKLKKLVEELSVLSENLKANKKSSSQVIEGKEEKAKQEKELLKGLQEKQASLEQAHRKQISEERLALQDQLERGELSGLMKQKLIKDHDETVAFLEKTLQRELEKLNMELEKELVKNRQDKTIHLNSLPETSDLQNPHQNILALLADNISIFQQAEQIAACRITLLGPQLFSSFGAPGENVPKALDSSPALTLLKEVDAELRANAQRAKIIQGCNEAGKDKGNEFRDTMDLQLTFKEDLTPVNPEQLTTREFVIYQYGIYILQLLQSHIQEKEINLYITSRLPGNDHKGNAFGHSFYYQSSGNNLFVSREYLQSVGSFVLLLVHCVSHISAKDFSDDSNPCFLRIFYQALKICLGDCFAARFQRASLVNKPSSNLQETQETEQQQAEKSSDFLSKLFLFKLKSSTQKPFFKGTWNRCKEMKSLQAVEIFLRHRVATMKREFSTQTSENSTQHIN